MLSHVDFKNMDTVLLKRLCKMAGIKKYSRLKKQELFDRYNEILAANLIARCFRNHFYRDATDHITLEPVSFPCFVYKTKSGKRYFYNYESIIKYIMKTGNTRDPMTREEYSDNDLKRLDAQAKLYFPEAKYRSTYKIKKSLVYAQRIRNRENEILSFELRITELKQLLIYIIDVDMLNWNIGIEPLLIENVEYQSIDSFIHSVIHELKLVIANLRGYDSNLAEMVKLELLTQINSNPKILELVNKI